LEGLFAVIFIIIGIVNFAMKQQQNQNQGRGQGGMKEKQRSYKVEQPRRIAQEYMPSPIMMEESEGTEEEDRSIQGSMVYVEDRNIQGSMVYVEDRNIQGSMNYVEQSQSSEGVDLALPKLEARRRKEKKPAPLAEVMEREETDAIFEITEDNLLSSIIMAEIIGPPRSMKRSIR